MNNVLKFLNYLKNSDLKKHIVYLKTIKEKKGEKYDIPDFISPEIKNYLKENGIEKIYIHQKEGLEKLNDKKNIIITTPTGSGKTLIYNTFVINHILKTPDSKALYIFPTKALTQDQLKTLKNFRKKFPSITAEIYDGDTPENIRKKIKRKFPSIVLTNPDMLHIGILPFYSLWREFFSELSFVVIDEVHTYKGIFGSNVSHVIRRLRRICNFYGSNPQFILSSATIKNSESFAGQLVGLDFESIKENSAPSGKKHFVFWDTLEDSPYTQTIELMKKSVENGLSTIVFTNSRRATELLQIWGIKNPSLKNVISSYRAGYLPEERREIEKNLFEGNLKGVISTSALELGIDIGWLDTCILFGYPGSIISTWQRAGRVGRKNNESIVIFVALSDALDKYFLKNPDELLEREFEDVIINFENEIITENHLKCACFEMPFSENEINLYGNFIKEILETKFKKTFDGRYFYSGKYPHTQVNLRTVGDIFSIVEVDTGKIIGEIEENKVYYDCHPGAIYLHLGNKYYVSFIKPQTKQVIVQKAKVDYYTQVNWWEKINIMDMIKEKGNEFKIKFGKIEVTTNFVSYEKRKEKDKTLIGLYQLNLPDIKFQTQSLWIEIHEKQIEEFKKRKIDFHGSIHAVEHSIIGIFPVEVPSDRGDIGGYSFPFHQQTEKATIFIYDGYPGGIGITKTGYERIEKILNLSYESVKGCKCESGCPSCIQSPKCGNKNNPLDKRGCLFLLETMLANI
ncbi:MAG TPA: DEAD/DEAH box helicase [bacterium]|nr:DEAD/DEAH box helicase [bacterium]